MGFPSSEKVVGIVKPYAFMQGLHLLRVVNRLAYGFFYSFTWVTILTKAWLCVGWNDEDANNTLNGLLYILGFEPSR